MRKKERARSERAHGSEAIDRIAGSDQQFCCSCPPSGGDKQLTFVRCPVVTPGLSRFLQSKTPSFRPSYLGRKQAFSLYRAGAHTDTHARRVRPWSARIVVWASKHPKVPGTRMTSAPTGASSWPQLRCRRPRAIGHWALRVSPAPAILASTFSGQARLTAKTAKAEL